MALMNDPVLAASVRRQASTEPPQTVQDLRKRFFNRLCRARGYQS